jgi:hypothetical protein
VILNALGTLDLLVGFTATIFTPLPFVKNQLLNAFETTAATVLTNSFQASQRDNMKRYASIHTKH